MAGLFLRLDTNYWRHPKIVAAGHMAGVLYQQMSMYCLDFATDGIVPDGQIPMFGLPKLRQLLGALEGQGLIERRPGGWFVPGYVERYKTAAEVAAARQTRQENGRKGGRPRKHPKEPNGNQDTNQPETEMVSGSVPPCETHSYRDRDTKEPSSSDTSATRPPAPDDDDPDLATELFQLASIVRPTPTAGHRKLLDRGLRRGWTEDRLRPKFAKAAGTSNPLAYVEAVLASIANEDPPVAPATNGQAPPPATGSWSHQWALMTCNQRHLADDPAKQAWHDTRLVRKNEPETTAKFAFRDAYLARSGVAEVAS